MSSANVLALIPARSGSKGIPHKNFTELAGTAPVERAYLAAFQAGIAQVVVSSDSVYALANWSAAGSRARLLERPPELAQDDTPMIAVVQHALEQIPGPPEQIILLLQPTQPLRQPTHLTAAIALLQSSGAESVVSVVELPLTYAPELLCGIIGTDYWDAERVGELDPLVGSALITRFAVGFECDSLIDGWSDMPTRRQAVKPVYQRDGSVYCFRRSTVAKHGNIYGEHVRPLIIPPEETCPLDTPEDWSSAERRLRARSDEA